MSQPNKPVVAHLILRFDIGGMEQVLADTVNGLSDTHRHIVVCLTSASSKHVDLLPPGTTVIQLQQSKPNDWRQWLRVYRILKSENVTVCHSYNISTLEYQWLAMLAGVRTRVHAEHGRNSSDPNGTYWKYVLIRKLCKPVVGCWVLVSTELYSWARDVIRLKPRKLRLIQNGVDTHKFSPESVTTNVRGKHWPEELRARSHFLFGTVGRLDPVKNQGLLLEAFASLLQQSDQADAVRLLVVGDGAQRSYLETLAIELGITKQVFFIGASRSVHLLLPELDVFVLTSDAEGLPITLLEAMACALPCISTDVGGISTVLNSQNGILVPAKNVNELSNAMMSCLSDRTLSKQLGNSARKCVEKEYGVSIMVGQYRQVYDGILEK